MYNFTVGHGTNGLGNQLENFVFFPALSVRGISKVRNENFPVSCHVYNAQYDAAGVSTERRYVNFIDEGELRLKKGSETQF
jgi:hypothetical protein